MAKYKNVVGKIVKVKKEWTFSEKVVMGLFIWTALVNIAAMVFAFINSMDSVWWYVVPGSFALTTTGLAGFTWKEKAENLIKIAANPNYDDEQLKQQVEYEIQQKILEVHREDFK